MAQPAAKRPVDSKPRRRPAAVEPPVRTKPVDRPAQVRTLASPAKTERARRRTSRSDGRAARAEAKRFTRASRRRRIAATGVIGVVVLLLAVLAIAVFSPILALRTIRVEGTSAIPVSSVRNALTSQLGTPLALLDEGKIRSELSHIILIRSYVTEVVPPNTLVVRVVERRAIGVLKHGSTYEQVDPAGVVLATSATPAGLPVIQIGTAGVNSAGFAAAVKVLRAMPASVLGQVGSISATTLDNVSLTLAQGNHIVIWGSAAQSDLKAAVLATLLKNCASQPVLNVTAPLALACGPAQAAPTATATPTPTVKP
jgi:cell division protein FtsQ